MVDIGDVGRQVIVGYLPILSFVRHWRIVSSLKFHEPLPLPGTMQLELPYVIVGDEAVVFRLANLEA